MNMQDHPYLPKPDEEDVVLGNLIQAVLDDIWWLIGVAAFVILSAAVYCAIAKPVYSADAHVRVETNDNTSQALTQTQTGQTINAGSSALPTDAEIEIIKSRGVVAPVVAQCKLNFSVAPVTMPLLGSIAARFATPGVPAKPWFGMSSYAWGGEIAEVDSMEVEPQWEGQGLTLTALGDSRYTLADKQGRVLLQGKAGESASGNGVNLLVSKLVARPGTRFKVTRANDLSAIASFQSRITVTEQGKQTGVIQISLENPNPEHAAEIANALAQSYVRQHVETKQADASKMLEFLKTEEPRLKADLQHAEAALTEYQREAGVINASDEAKVYLEGSINYEAQISSLRLQISTLEQRYGDLHPSLATARQQLAQLEAQRERYASRFRDLPQSEVKAVALQRDAKVAEDIYVLLLNRVQELSVQRAGTGGNVHIVDAALRPGDPVKPKKVLIMSAAVILGLILGTGFVFARRAIFKGIDDPERLERVSALPIFGLVPQSVEQTKFDTDAKRRREPVHEAPILVTMRPNDMCVEIMRSLRTSIQFSLMEARNRVVMMTGPASGVGKSFLSLNLAVLLAATGKKVLLIDGDMRRGKLERSFDGKRAPGLAELLAGSVSLEEAIRTTRVPSLDFIAAGKRPENPSELLMSPRLQQYFDALGRSYDVILIDTPPVLAVTDALIVGKLAGTNFLVLRSGAHNEAEITEASRRLRTAGIAVLGAILNGTPQRARGYGRAQYAAVEEYVGS
ncbi:exopolysaccharide biosynthesis protein [Caballeronia hypogeia]|uniref:Putative tyrosine-protein kinase EpsB n=1 Tax=Caballeronia hypogeia TaxID=1777140 RepID=A0A158A2A6_9BURK|nr:exopolysaccharide biosynthesis protein [Caballeronia hypogeia]